MIIYKLFKYPSNERRDGNGSVVARIIFCACLKNWCNFGNFKIVWKNIEMQQLKMSVIEDDITCAENFGILLGMSIPLALPLGKLTSKIYRCLRIICFSLKDV